jgi:hypothetical protein
MKNPAKTLGVILLLLVGIGVIVGTIAGSYSSERVRAKEALTRMLEKEKYTIVNIYYNPWEAVQWLAVHTDATAVVRTDKGRTCPVGISIDRMAEEGSFWVRVRPGTDLLACAKDEGENHN